MYTWFIANKYDKNNVIQFSIQISTDINTKCYKINKLLQKSTI